MYSSTTPIVKPKLDVIFKRIFGTEANKGISKAFLAEVLALPRDSLGEITFRNVEILPDEYGKKFCRLDLYLTAGQRKINIEIQVYHDLSYKERSLFYWAKKYTDDLKSGEDYGQLKQTICINLLDDDLFEAEEYHSEFLCKENHRGEILCNKLDIHFFELKKYIRQKGRSDGMERKPIDDWMDLLTAETEGDLESLEAVTEDSEVRNAIRIVRDLSGDPKVRAEAELREKQMHDEASAISGAIKKGLEQGLQQGREQGRAEILFEMVLDGTVTKEQASSRAGMTLPEFETALAEFRKTQADKTE